MASSPNSKMIQNAKRFVSNNNDNNNNIDMDAYPILRIDELANATDNILKQALNDIPELINKLKYEDRKNLVQKENPLLKYAKKQIEAMEEEITRRNALNRVKRMLKGVEEIKPKSYDNITTGKTTRPRSSSAALNRVSTKPPTSPIMSARAKSIAKSSNNYNNNNNNSPENTNKNNNNNNKDNMFVGNTMNARPGVPASHCLKKVQHTQINNVSIGSKSSSTFEPATTITNTLSRNIDNIVYNNDEYTSNVSNMQNSKRIKYQSRYSQSALEAERKKKKLEYSSFVVSTGTKKKKKTNVFARRQRAEKLKAKRDREALQNRRKSQRTSKNLEAAREMLRLKALRREERAKRRKILKDIMQLQQQSMDTQRKQNSNLNEVREFVDNVHDNKNDKSYSNNTNSNRQKLNSKIPRIGNVNAKENNNNDINIVNNFTDEGQVANDSGDDSSNDEFDVVNDEDETETEDQRINRITNELKRLEERDLVDDEEDENSDDDIVDTNDLVDDLFNQNDLQLPKPRSTPRGWRDQFDDTATNPHQDNDNKSETEANVILNEIRKSGTKTKKYQNSNISLSSKQPVKLQAWEKQHGSKKIENGSIDYKNINTKECITTTSDMSEPNSVSAKPVWLQPPPVTNDIKQQYNNVKRNPVGTQNAGNYKQSKLKQPSPPLGDKNVITKQKSKTTKDKEKIKEVGGKRHPSRIPQYKNANNNNNDKLNDCIGTSTTNNTNKSNARANINSTDNDNSVLVNDLSGSGLQKEKHNTSSLPKPVVIEPIGANENLPTGNALLSMFGSDDSSSDDDAELIATKKISIGVSGDPSMQHETQKLSASPITISTTISTTKDQKIHNDGGCDNGDNNYTNTPHNVHNNYNTNTEDIYGMYEEDGKPDFDDDSNEDEPFLGTTTKLNKRNEENIKTRNAHISTMIKNGNPLSVGNAAENISVSTNSNNNADHKVTSNNKQSKAFKAKDIIKYENKTLSSNRYENTYKTFSDIFSAVHEAAKSKNVAVDEIACIDHHIKQLDIWHDTMKTYLNSCSNNGDVGEDSTYVDGLYFEVHQCKGRHEVVDIVTRACAERIGNWHVHPSNIGLHTRTWNLLWTWSRPRIKYESLFHFQRVNHFPGSRELTRKDTLKKNLHRFTGFGGKLAKQFDIMPRTFCLPREYLSFVEAFSRLAEEEEDRFPLKPPGSINWWILKPAGLSRGRGISLLNDIGQVSYGTTAVIQRYCHNPLLLDGYKFDLRLYVLVTSFNPLEAFYYEDGFVRIATVPYSKDPADLHNLFIHLTNSSIQKDNLESIPKFKGGPRRHSNKARIQMTGMGPSDSNWNDPHPMDSANPDEVGGSKLKISYLWRRLKEQNVDVSLLKERIHDVILKSLVAAEEAIPPQVNSFELYGYDILIDDTYKPWLIEVNASPAMACDNALDKHVKNQLIEDTIRLVNPLPFDRKALRSELIGRKDYLDTQKKRPYANPTAMFKSHQDALNAKRDELDAKLSKILKGNVPRKYGDMPKHLGKYKRIAPGTKLFNNAVKLRRLGLASRKSGTKGQQKRFNSTIGGTCYNNNSRRRRQQMAGKRR